MRFKTSWSIAWVLGLSLGLAGALQSGGSYSENLDLTPLPRNSVLATFQFDILSDPILITGNDSFDFGLEGLLHYGLFPRSVGQIVKSTGTHELHLRFTQGWWDSELWGSLPNGGKSSGGTGVEAWAWIAAQSEAEAQDRWFKLVNALSGLFCASLNFVDATKTTQNPMSFTPDSKVPLGSTSSTKLSLFHGALPRESICTENLTPFVKLLPCKGKVGLSSLLDGHRIFDAKWQSMSLDFVPVRSDTDDVRLHMVQRVEVVLDVLRALQRKIKPVPDPPPIDQLHCDTSKPYHSGSSCYPLPGPEVLDWKLSDLFGSQVEGSCPLVNGIESIKRNPANNYSICSYTTADWNVHANKNTSVFENQDKKCFGLPASDRFDLSFSTSNTSSVVKNDSPPVYVQRSMTGRGQQHGGIQIIISNPSNSQPVQVSYLETLPWFMKPYIHTLTTLLTTGTSVSQVSIENDNVFNKILYRPFLERVRGTYLELTLTIPPASVLTISYDFDKSLLYLGEYPPDANRGFDVAPGILAVIDCIDHDNERIFSYVTRTSSLLLALPTPDFSMPYNVIIFTSTVMALAFGTIYNILVRRFVYEEDAEDERQANRLKVFKKISSFKARLGLSKRASDKDVTEQDDDETKKKK
ncbi:GPI transamidase component PIG-T [Lipomyces japonicus]|uniref:GPI transamidase component PIG-T n=1 Tax=Lipomyces japonicus TaxID=56871 RepID=UPI0034CD0DEF